eukprot:9480611-Pyramimonas_sp.AAC.1
MKSEHTDDTECKHEACESHMDEQLNQPKRLWKLGGDTGDAGRTCQLVSWPSPRTLDGIGDAKALRCTQARGGTAHPRITHAAPTTRG